MTGTIHHLNTHRVVRLPVKTLDDLAREHGCDAVPDLFEGLTRHERAVLAKAGFKLTLAERLADMVREDWPAVVFGFALGLMCICIPAIVLGAVL